MPIRDRLPLGHRDDPSVQRDLNWDRNGVDLPTGLEIQWLGTAGFRLTHLGTTVLIEDEIPDRGVDVFLCGIAGRAFTRHFVRRAIRALDPSLIVAHHHDDFFRPIEAEMGFSLNVNLGGFAEDVARTAPDVPVRTFEPLQTVTG